MPPERNNAPEVRGVVVIVVVRGGVEPPTFRVSVGRSYQLSYLTLMYLCVPSGPDGI